MAIWWLGCSVWLLRFLCGLLGLAWVIWLWWFGFWWVVDFDFWWRLCGGGLIGFVVFGVFYDIDFCGLAGLLTVWLVVWCIML